ncbi:MAG: type II secretion system protein [Gemmatimonadetes bacterium]|nr:type II secretion system protein [Gemmatimonadota bacterium]MDA1102744.1 type II secretion system protein [Gemmatimonadota bacterium]
MNRIRRPRDGRRDSRRGGFSLIELLMTLSIVGILAGLAIPNLRGMTYRARATEVAGDLEVVRVATLSYNGTTHRWPADAAQGVVPPELNGFLPEGFSFQGNGFELKYENYNLPGGLPGDPTTTQLIAVSVTVDLEEMSNAVVELLGGSIVFSVGRKHTVIIDRS